MVSDKKKLRPTQQNSRKSTGPKTKLGKERASRNATKHAVLARELMVNDADKPEFETMR